MIREIKLEREEMDEIMAHLPESLRKKLHSAIHDNLCEMGIKEMKSFVEQYEDDNQLDRVISFTCATMIGRIVNGVSILQREKEGNRERGINGHDMARIICHQLRTEADKIEEAIQEHEEHPCCSKKH